MRTVFSKISGDSPDSYVREKIRSGLRRSHVPSELLENGFVEGQVSDILRTQPSASVPIALPEDHYEITQEQAAEVEARKRCAIAALMRESPLLEGEVIEEDFFTFLKEPYGPVPANTAALHRKTNMAELYYLFDDLRVENGDLVFQEPPAQPASPLPRAGGAMKLGAGKFNAATLAKSVGTGLISGFAGQIGALIFDAIFPPDVPSYFDEVYKEVGKIVRQELTESDIKRINGRINGTVAWLRNTYKPRKESGASRKDLHDMVTPYVNLFYTEGVYTLMEPDYAKPGLPVFLLAAGTHLALMQEQALVDPNQEDPTKSSYARSVQLSAQEYYNHATKTYDETIKQRREMIKLKYDPLIPEGCDVGGSMCIPKSRYRWYDEFENTWGRHFEEYKDKDKNYHSGEQEGEADRQQRLNYVTTKLTENLGSPRTIADGWLKLKDRPIPR